MARVFIIGETYGCSRANSKIRSSTYKKLAVKMLNEALCYYQSLCLIDSEVVNQNLMLRMKFSGENRHPRKAAKRYGQV